MLEIASQMILCLLLAALLGLIIGYLLGRGSCGNNDCEEITSKVHDEVKNKAYVSHDKIKNASTEECVARQKPLLLAAPRNGKKDDLTLIKGIGLKIEDALNNAGVYHFDQIAAWNAENIAWADSTLDFPGRAEREQWVAQAEVLAKGEEA